MIQENANNPQRLRRIRQQSQRDIPECASLLDISIDQFQKYENGTAQPSLPEIELLSIFFRVPIKSFYQADAHEISNYSFLNKETKSKYKQLRNKVILTELQIEQEKKGVTLEYLNTITGIPLETLQQYSRGDLPISFNHLIQIAEAFDQPISIFFNQVFNEADHETIELDQPHQHLENQNGEDKVDQKNEKPDDPLPHAIRQMPLEEQAEIAKIILGKLKTK
ncbi:MAG: helix-turn-helix transcriptional regulator [Chloroflexota bacterium]|nr:helix-turn-helix transcriptional regulator [Chloroflexota bacterium]